MESKAILECVSLNKVVLVNFEEQMIDKYHEWMQDSYLLESTSTEPMTKIDIRDASHSWKFDPNKYTYIICDKTSYNESFAHLSMIGDVNLFINEDREGEINIMIADALYRNKGIASEVINYIKFMSKAVLRLSRLYAKIHQENVNSQRLFMKQGFIEIARIPEFEEIQYAYDIN